VKISIITVTYNSGATLGQTIRSVASQSYNDIEYIVVDGGSKDNTTELIKKYSDVIAASVSEKDQGLYHALNKGIAMATGEVIGMLHSDDFYINNEVVQKYADTFIKTGADAVYSDLYYVNAQNTDKIVRKWKSGFYREGNFKWGWMPPHPTFFVKKEVYNRFGDFNLNFKTAADYELMLRFIHKHKIRLAYLPEFTIKMRVGGKSNASLLNRLLANKEDRMAWKTNGLKPGWFTLSLKPLRKILQFI
jgi:glycosyltransferase involved in cell wall biosynthesis